MDEFQLLYDDENVSVLLPTYLVDTLSSSDQESEMEGENFEDSEFSENSGDSSVGSIDDVIINQNTIIAQIDNLNSNLCVFNDNLIILNNNLLFLIGVSSLALFFTLVNFAIRIFNNTLGLGKV